MNEQSSANSTAWSLKKSIKKCLPTRQAPRLPGAAVFYQIRRRRSLLVLRRALAEPQADPGVAAEALARLRALPDDLALLLPGRFDVAHLADAAVARLDLRLCRGQLRTDHVRHRTRRRQRRWRRPSRGTAAADGPAGVQAPARRDLAGEVCELVGAAEDRGHHLRGRVARMSGQP